MRRLAALLLWLAAGSAAAIEYRSVGEATLLYDAPSLQAQPQFAIARGTPVEVVVQLDLWVKVRVPTGELAWINRALLSDKRHVMVRGGRSEVRAQAAENAVVVFEAEPDVLLEFIEAGPVGWLKVRHRDGQQGFIKATQVWGD